MIEARQLTKVFRDKKRGEIKAVDAVSFRCQPGQIFGLLGVNGAGKTTCLRLLGTILQPSSGTASVSGFDTIGEPAKVRASIGFLSTATALYGRLTAQEMVEYFGRLALVPVVNISLVAKEILSGTYHWSYILLIFGSTSVYAAAVALFKRESVLFRM
jgi:ABC-type Na+ transport system ATPase subunit NatA